MRKHIRFAAVAATFLLLHSSEASAELLTTGNADCGKWINARKQNTANAYEWFLRGVLNGMALGSDKEFWEAGGVKISGDQADAWMDKWCRENPLSNVIDGAKSLFLSRTLPARR